MADYIWVWQYKMVTPRWGISNELPRAMTQDEMNELGADGWELMHVSRYFDHYWKKQVLKPGVGSDGHAWHCEPIGPDKCDCKRGKP